MLLIVQTDLNPKDIQHIELLRFLFGDIDLELAERLWKQVKDYAEYLKAKAKEVKNERRGDK